MISIFYPGVFLNPEQIFIFSLSFHLLPFCLPSLQNILEMVHTVIKDNFSRFLFVLFDETECL